MNRDVARLTCRDFLEARLVEHAAEGGAMREFKERGVWKVTPKGFAVYVSPPFFSFFLLLRFLFEHTY